MTNDGNSPCPKGSLLVVDDDRQLADTLRELLQLDGFAVQVANAGEEALTAIRAGDFDAIICDMMLQDMRGDEFFHTAVAEKPELTERFIFTTGHSDHPRVMDFLEAHDSRILFKPFGQDELLRAARIVTSS